MLDLMMKSQPDDETCGPTCLNAIYQYYALQEPLEQTISGVKRSRSGGTLAPLLACHALERDLDALIYVNNLDVFDPTWFKNHTADPVFLIKKLEEQLRHKDDPAIQESSHAYIEFLSKGGAVRYQTLTVSLLKHFFKQNTPILTGLSATYLYNSARESFTPEGRSRYDDIRGTPCGHFVVLCGYDEKHRRIIVADPHRENPLSHNNYYKVSSHHLINAILLGVYTYDANLLVISQRDAVCKPY